MFRVNSKPFPAMSRIPNNETSPRLLPTGTRRGTVALRGAGRPVDARGQMMPGPVLHAQRFIIGLLGHQFRLDLQGPRGIAEGDLPDGLHGVHSGRRFPGYFLRHHNSPFRDRGEMAGLVPLMHGPASLPPQSK